MPLRLTLELVPRGIENHRRTVGILEIENTADHTDHPTKANYKFRMTGPIDGGSVGLWHQGILKDIDRDRGYWAHVKEVLSQLDCESKEMSID
jgi:hypothetical protein